MIVRTLTFLISIVLLSSVVVAGPDEKNGPDNDIKIPPWRVARQIICDCHGGIDLELSVTGGYERRDYSEGPIEGPYASAGLTVPIYSRKERVARKAKLNAEIEHLTDLYAEYEQQSAIIDALKNEVALLKKTLIDSGADGISKYYDLVKLIEKSRAERKGAQRKIKSMLENCSRVEAN